MNPLVFLQTQTDTTKLISLNIQDTLQKMGDMSVPEMIGFLLDSLIRIGLKILAAVVIYSVGAWIIRKSKKILRDILEKRHADPSLGSFLQSLLSIALTLILIIITVGTLGVDTSSLVALLAGSGLAVGMALSGTLQNFAGGIMILLFKPFKVGDYIEAQGYAGTVESIQITATRILTTDNKMVILPNGALSNGTINNYSATGVRRCEWKVGISYGDDLQRARQVIVALLDAHPAVLRQPVAPFVALDALADSSVNLVVRAWVKSEDYWTLFYDIHEQIYAELPRNGLHFPFPQLDVHLPQDSATPPQT